MTIEHIISMLAPHYCVLCDTAGKPLCDMCQVGVFEARKPACHLCNIATDGALLCGACLSQKQLANAWNVDVYDGALKYLIQQYKFEHGRGAARPLAQLLHYTLPEFLPDTIVAYVPTAPARVRQRGFDHAKLLAKEFARARNMPLYSPLARTNNSRQVGATRAERVRQAKSLFSVKPGAVQRLPYLVIDDVMTTGATIDAATGLLLRSGAEQVYAAVVANERLATTKHDKI